MEIAKSPGRAGPQCWLNRLFRNISFWRNFRGLYVAGFLSISSLCIVHCEILTPVFQLFFGISRDCLSGMSSWPDQFVSRPVTIRTHSTDAHSTDAHLTDAHKPISLVSIIGTDSERAHVNRFLNGFASHIVQCTRMS